MENEVIELMKQYFINRDKIKEIKKARNKWFNENEIKSICCNLTYSNKEELCINCKKRVQFFISIQKIKHENIGIISKVRRRVK